ncbi:type II toxin-antitoxin system RelB/DinJ family antitoxin [bacterium]|nr:type II toxin-antitoxin system RelB/DinJ family antitoxin [bacterium]
MREATITARVDADSKNRVEIVLKKLGLTHSSAINLFYNQILLQGGLPFELKIPESVTSVVPAARVAEPTPTYNAIENIIDDVDAFPQNIRKLISSFGKSARAKEALVKLAVEYFIDEMEFIAEAEKRVNDKNDGTVSEEEFKKEFGLE